jgi:hypothetical protein
MSVELITRPQVFVKTTPSKIPEVVKHLYGSGLSYPIALANSKFEISDTEKRIRDSIYIIMSTPIGTRFRRPDFGSMLPYMVFNSFTQVFISEAILYTKESIAKWEPRISIKGVDVNSDDIDENIINIRIYYYIKGTGIERDIIINFNVSNLGSVPYSSSSLFTLGGNNIFPKGN